MGQRRIDNTCCFLSSVLEIYRDTVIPLNFSFCKIYEGLRMRVCWFLFVCGRSRSVILNHIEKSTAKFSLKFIRFKNSRSGLIKGSNLMCIIGNCKRVSER